MTPIAWWLLAAFVISTYVNIWLLNERMKLLGLIEKAALLIGHLHEERRNRVLLDRQGSWSRGDVPDTFD